MHRSIARSTRTSKAQSAYASIGLLGVLIIAGCGEKELLSDLSEKQSREVLVALSSGSISADREKAKGANGKFSITVSDQNYSRALQLLEEQELPRRAIVGCETALGTGSFIPDSPEIVLLRRDCVLSAEVEKILSGIQGVIDVRAVVRANSKGENPVRAAVVIRSNSVAARSLSEVDAIKQLVVQVVPELSPDFVTVKFTRTNVKESTNVIGSTEGENGRVDLTSLKRLWPGVFDFNVPVSEQGSARQRIMLILLGVFTVATVLGGVLGYLLTGARKLKTARRERKGSIVQESFFNERKAKLEEGVEARESQRRSKASSGNVGT